MKVSEIIDQLGLKVVSGGKGLDREISGAYVSDLLSDVMGNAHEGQVWITLQVHQNVMAIASLKDMAAVILVKDLKANENTIHHSNEEQIPILSSSLSTFEIAGKLYALLNGQ
ncbi:DRTGG domain-containing protein [Mangrovibacterium diazotrophicum]|uniref:DRTGG domain-containing protein n=1 Tax=Mangrovibacterium diazotrophicum TaxID=1261403 RepID=A0A419VXG5_9BACT|nr:DRTGG domain-containing protein [Mangrovibacterium diazotrophicum]RKD87896.1 DRTGG domain-containing protein [Mangrovibacterium diazotrophicum]